MQPTNSVDNSQRNYPQNNESRSNDPTRLTVSKLAIDRLCIKAECGCFHMCTFTWSNESEGHMTLDSDQISMLIQSMPRGSVKNSAGLFHFNKEGSCILL